MLNNSSKNVNNQLLEKIRSLEEENRKLKVKKDDICSSAQTESDIFEAHESLLAEHENLNIKLIDYAKLNEKMNTALVDLKQLPSVAQDKTIEQLKERQLKLETELSMKNTELGKTVHEKEKQTNDLKSLKREVTTLKENHVILSKHLQSREDELCEMQNTSQPMSDMIAKKVSLNIQTLFNERFNNIEANIDEIKKVSSTPLNVERIEEKINAAVELNKSYAASAKKNLAQSNLAEVIKVTKNDDLVQQREREKRAKNLIVYNISEECEGELKTHDEEFVASFLETIGVATQPKQITRLGDDPNNKKMRPVKLVMENEEQKNAIMSRLVNLRTAEEIYRQLSVRDDYTIEERELIRSYAAQAKKQNERDNTTEWKVRGTPKNGLVVRRIKSRQN